MKSISAIELLSIINNAKSHEIGLVFVSNSSVRRKTCGDIFMGPLGYVAGVVEGRFTINENYSDTINRKLQQKGILEKFEAGPAPYGVWLNKDKVLSYGDKAYLRTFYSGNDIKVTLIDKHYDPVPDSTVNLHKMLVPFQTRSPKQMKAGLEADECVMVRNVRLDSIVTIKVDGVSYRVNSLKKAVKADRKRTFDKFGVK